MSAKAKRSMGLLALACGACLDFGPDTSNGTVDVTPPRLLDALCARNAYVLEGAATRIAGPTADSCAFELGPGPGSVTFPNDALPEFSEVEAGYGVLDALVVDLAERSPEAHWVLIAAPARASSTVNGGAPPPPQAELTVSSDGGHLAVLDIEVKVSTTFSGGCSVPHGSRRPSRAPIFYTRRSWTPTAS
jgi:hypothetical protein